MINYIFNQFVLQECRKIVELCLTVKNQWGLLTGDHGVGCGGISMWSIK